MTHEEPVSPLLLACTPGPSTFQAYRPLVSYWMLNECVFYVQVPAFLQVEVRGQHQCRPQSRSTLFSETGSPTEFEG